jgi:Uma2 family endonuclease
VAIEILSKDDRVEQMQIRINDYLTFGIRYVWVINPRTRVAWVYTKGGAHEVKDGMLRTENPAIELPLPEIFEALQ